MGDLGVQDSICPSVRPSVRPFVFPSTFTLGVLWAQLLLQFCTDHFETLHVFSPWYEDVHALWDRIVRLFLSLFPHCKLSHFSPQYIDSRYLLWAQLLLQFYTDCCETLHVISSWYEDVQVVWVELLEYFCHFFHIVNLVSFISKYINNGYLLWAQLLLQLCIHYYETLHAFSSWYEDVHVVWM